jgi:membrane fusion protein (multidrug efflux system)
MDAQPGQKIDQKDSPADRLVTSPPSTGKPPESARVTAAEVAPPGESAPPAAHGHPLRKKVILVTAAIIGLAAVIYFGIPWIVLTFTTVSTDDAYVNGHVTFVAARVPGQVKEVLVDDNKRVKKGQKLVLLDKEPYQVQVNIKKAALEAAEKDRAAAEAQVHALASQCRSNYYKLEHAIEDVDHQIANLGAAAATLKSKEATLKLARQKLKIGEDLAPKGSIAQEELDERKQAVKVGEAAVEQTIQEIYAIRVGLGLPAEPDKGKPFTDVPKELNQNFSTVRQALADLIQSAAQIGYFSGSWNATPKQTVEAFLKQDVKGDLNRIYEKLMNNAPLLHQAEAKLLQARRDLDQAELNLRYTDVLAEIDGVVTRRNVNPGNNVTAGQSLMAIRSLTEIWIDANFKETQLASLKIGQPVKVEVDMYGSHHEFEGRITGFTFGTGQTLALLPPQNATGNFVKIVQRLPVKVELNNYDPEKVPLFVGLSVTPYVYIHEPLIGNDPGKGKALQPLLLEQGQ